MDRIRVVGMKENNDFLASKESSQGPSGDEIIKKNNILNSSNRTKSSAVDFPLIRKKVKLNAKKKTSLIKLHHAKTRIKRNNILQLRREKFEKYRIDFMPLCLDEDLEKLAASLSKDSKK